MQYCSECRFRRWTPWYKETFNICGNRLSNPGRDYLSNRKRVHSTAYVSPRRFYVSPSVWNTRGTHFILWYFPCRVPTRECEIIHHTVEGGIPQSWIGTIQKRRAMMYIMEGPLFLILRPEVF